MDLPCSNITNGKKGSVVVSNINTYKSLNSSNQHLHDYKYHALTRVTSNNYLNACNNKLHPTRDFTNE